MITGGDGNDVINGGYGNDTLDGGNGVDTYLFAQNFGNDVILNNGTGKDVVCFMTPTDYSFSRDMSNNDLVISYGNNDSVTLKDYYGYKQHVVKGIRVGNKTTAIEYSMIQKGLNITGTNGNDNYELNLDKKYVINDAAGNDSLKVTGASNLNILFNVDCTYTLSSGGINFGDISLVDDDQLENWKSGSDYKGFVIKNNAVESIEYNNQSIQSSDIAQLAADVAGWLNTNGFTSVQAVLDSNNTADINALIAEFQGNANWQPLQ